MTNAGLCGLSGLERMLQMIDMKLKRDTAYKVVKGNSDGSVLAGDIIYIDSKNGDLVANTIGWLSSDELTEEIMDFEGGLIHGKQNAREPKKYARKRIYTCI